MTEITDELHDMLNDLTNEQAMMYNDIIYNFNQDMREDIRPRGNLRLGQAFYNYGYALGVFNGSFPELFYCEDNQKSMEMIVNFMCAYVKEKTC